MSQFALPRIYFRGRAVVNPPTGNNLVETKTDLDLEIEDNTLDATRVGGRGLAFCDPVNVRINARETDRLKLMRMAERQAYDDQSNWNYYGDFRFFFDQVTVRRVALSDGSVVSDRKIEPLIGAEVSLRKGIMVDLDPTAITTSQVIAEEFLISNGKLSVTGRPERHFARRFSDARINGTQDPIGTGAAVFQTLLDLSVIETGQSPVLIALKQEIAEKRPLFLQYTLFNGSRRWRAEELADEYAHGRYPSNPCSLDLFGTITPGEPGLEHLEAAVTQRVLFETATREGRRFGPAVAFLDRPRRALMLDLATTFTLRRRELVEDLEASRESSPTGPADESTPKRIIASADRAPRNNVTVAAGSRFSRKFSDRFAVLEAGAGLVEFALDQDQLKVVEQEPLTLKVAASGADSQRVLDEAEVTLSFDRRALYLEGTESVKMKIVAGKGGKLLSGSEALEIEVVPSAMSRGRTALSYLKTPKVVEVSGDGIESLSGWRYRGAIGPAGLSLHFSALRPGAVHVLFNATTKVNRAIHKLAVETAQNSLAPPAGDLFANIRVLPSHEFSKERPTFEQVYEEVLKYYDVIFPYMSQRHFSFANRGDVRINAKQILLRLDLKEYDPGLMPPSRDMSQGKRELLRRYLKAVLSEQDTP